MTQAIQTLSHELRTPLTVILGSAFLLQEGIQGHLTEEQHESVRRIVTSAKVMQRLATDLLDLAQLESGKLKLRREDLDMAQLAKGTLELLAPLAASKELSLTLLSSEEGLRVNADAERIQQVLFNLVGNALKFTPAGGRISVKLDLQGDSVVCSVLDTGIGIADDDLPSLFEAFAQLADGFERGGVGLGLSICKALVTAHQGRIGVESKLGVGSRFWFSLPAVLSTPEGSQIGLTDAK